MHAQRTFALVSFAVLTLLCAGSTARAANPCLVDAKQEYKDCKATCKEDFQAAKDACLDRDHACVEVCRADRSECREETGFDDAITACNQTLDDARQSCRNANPPGPDRDACIDQAQVVAFQCRDDAREAAKKPLKQCRADFKTCARACGPNEPPDRAGKKQCKADAVAAYRSCQATCREDKQVAVDACKNRDHACVEDCRSNRTDCRRPIIEQREAAVDQCNADRADAVDNCKALYGEGTPERDQCIDNAQVVAFQCRDQAREDAHPGLNECRAQFRQCAEACPPPAP